MKVVIAILLGIGIGFWLDDPADRVVTETTTERVEVPGPEVVRYERPALPQECLTYIDRATELVNHVEAFVDAQRAQEALFSDALQALMNGSTNEINNSITRQNEIQSEGLGEYTTIIETEELAGDWQERCLREMEELK